MPGGAVPKLSIDGMVRVWGAEGTRVVAQTGATIGGDSPGERRGGASEGCGSGKI